MMFERYDALGDAAQGRPRPLPCMVDRPILIAIGAFAVMFDGWTITIRCRRGASIEDR